MLRSVKNLRGYKMLATDGEIGKVDEFYFDDVTWTIRYLVVNTGSWFFERRVLLSPIVLGQPHWAGRVFPVMLTRRQIKSSPIIDKDKPVSRQQEIELHQYYDWPYYWIGSGMTGAGAPVIPPRIIAEQMAHDKMAQDKKETAAGEERDPHLRSTREVIEYHIQARDGELGHVEDFIVDDEKWMIRYMVVDTRNWLPGRKVLVSPLWIKKITWAESKVDVGLTQDKIKDSPEFDPSIPVNRKYEEQLYDFYGRPRYWQ